MPVLGLHTHARSAGGGVTKKGRNLDSKRSDTAVIYLSLAPPLHRVYPLDPPFLPFLRAVVATVPCGQRANGLRSGLATYIIARRLEVLPQGGNINRITAVQKMR